MRESFVDLIQANSDPDDICFIDSSKKFSYTYARLFADIENQLALSQFKKRSLVFLPMNFSYECVVRYLTCLKADMPILLLDPNSPSVQLIETYQPEYRWDLSGNLEKLKGEENFGELNSELSLLLSTSGSTGSPKLVRLSQKNIISNAVAIKTYLKLNSSDRAISVLPFYYSFGLSILNSHLLAGASLCLTESSLLQKDFWEHLRDGCVTSLSGVPYTFQILERLKFLDQIPPSLKTVTQAGGKLSAELVSKYAKTLFSKGVQFFVMYGQTEATARIAYLEPGQALVRPASIGKAIPGGEFHILRNGQLVNKPHEVGEIFYQGPNVMLGYAESRNDLSLGNQLNGRLATGDLGYFDEDGYFYVTGRSKRISKVLGLRINLDEMESLFKTAFDRVAVVSDDQKISVFFEEAVPQNWNEFSVDYCRRCQIHPSVLKVKVIDQLPLLSSGKINYSELATR